VDIGYNPAIAGTGLEVSNGEEGFLINVAQKHFAIPSLTYKGNVREILMKRIKLCCKLWVKDKRTRWHSPYLSLVLSSGLGKTSVSKENATSIVDEKLVTSIANPF
jgi:hypothetical protein